MADIHPFRGLRYNPAKVPDLVAVVAPPYDIISPTAQEVYYARSSYNIVRLELAQKLPLDNEENNCYTRAAATFAEWQRNQVLMVEPTPTLYSYRQTFLYEGRELTRYAILARVRLEEWARNVILPHEDTLSKPKADRLQLLRACQANFSPIFSLYEDASGILPDLLKEAPAATSIGFHDEADEAHELLSFNDAALLAKISHFFSTRQLFIADGHHRYETALAYRDEVRQTYQGNLPPNHPANFVLMALVELSDPGLLVLPTHRVVHQVTATQYESLATRLRDYFLVESYPASGQGAMLEIAQGALQNAGQHIVFAAVGLVPGQVTILQMKPEAKREMARAGHSSAWQGLDVSVLHTLILDALLGIGQEAATTGEHLTYLRDARAAIEAGQGGRGQVAFLLNPTRVSQIRDVALAGDRMPQKSTYFYPKLITGLVLNPLGE